MNNGKNGNPIKKIGIALLLIGVIGAIIICIVSTAQYGRIYMFDGYESTAMLWILCFALIVIGVILTAVGSAMPKPAGESNSGFSPQAPVANEDMSAKAQFAFNQKVNEFSAAYGRMLTEAEEAALFAQAVELQLLKAPASAKFCALEEMTIKFDGVKYVVSGYVDSQNSYGAMVRTPFTLTVFKASDGQWKNANAFIGTNVSIGASVVGHTLLYWIIGIIFSVISFFIIYAIISSKF